MRPGWRAERLKKLAGAATWSCAMTAVVLVPISRGWTVVASVFTLVLTVLTLTINLAVAGALPGGSRWGRQPKGGSRGGASRGDDGGLTEEAAHRPAEGAAHRWHTLVLASRLMPRSAGSRWLAEAESLLAELTPDRRGPALRSYLLSAPRLALMMWAREALRRAHPGPRRPG